MKLILNYIRKVLEKIFENILIATFFLRTSLYHNDRGLFFGGDSIVGRNQDKRRNGDRLSARGDRPPYGGGNAAGDRPRGGSEYAVLFDARLFRYFFYGQLGDRTGDGTVSKSCEDRRKTARRGSVAANL